VSTIWKFSIKYHVMQNEDFLSFINFHFQIFKGNAKGDNPFAKITFWKRSKAILGGSTE
jgi:hypothetical protein